MTIGGAGALAIRPKFTALALCAAAILVALAMAGFGTTSVTLDTQSTVGTVESTGSIHVDDTRHTLDDCGHDHESAECSPCPSCSAVALTAAESGPDINMAARVPSLQSHYDDVVPTGIRRPPRLS